MPNTSTADFRIPPAKASNTGSHIPGLDGLRALAVTGVIIYHVFPGILPGGFLGVDMFFVISGFLITTLILRDQQAGEFKLRRFWRNRARRILPAVTFMLTVCCLLTEFVGGDAVAGLRRQIWGALTFSSNWTAIAAGSTYFSQDSLPVFRNLWSLAVEEQFYLVWPIVLLAVSTIAPRKIVGMLLLLSIASASLMAALFTPGADATRVYFGSDTHLFGLTLGAALAFWRYSHSPIPTRGRTGHTLASWALGLFGLAVLLVASLQFHDDAAATYRGGLFGVSLATAFVILSASRPGTHFGRLLDNHLFRYVGRRSYGLYLWHWPLFVLLGDSTGTSHKVTGLTPLIGVAAITATVTVAELSFEFIEQPIRRWGFRAVLSPRVIRRMPWTGTRITVAASLSALLILGTGATAHALTQPDASTQAEQQISAGQAALQHQHTAPPETPTPTPGLSNPVAPPIPPTPSATSPTAAPTVTAPAPTTSSLATAPPAPETPTPSTPPPAPAPAAPATAAIQGTAIGDSVMLASAPALLAAMPHVYIDAKVGRQPWDAPALLQSLVSTGRLQNTVILGLGTNGNITTSNLEQIRNIIGPERRLVLVNVFANRSWQAPDNAVLNAFARTHPHTAVADWHDAIAAHQDLLGSDDVHPGNAGGALYAQSVISALRALNVVS